MRRILALGVVLTLFSLPALADEVGGEDIRVPTRPAARPMTSGAEKPVTAAPPPYLALESTRLAAGIGISWGDGTLSFEGQLILEDRRA